MSYFQIICRVVFFISKAEFPTGYILTIVRTFDKPFPSPLSTGRRPKEVWSINYLYWLKVDRQESLSLHYWICMPALRISCSCTSILCPTGAHSLLKAIITIYVSLYWILLFCIRIFLHVSLGDVAMFNHFVLFFTSYKAI